MNTNSIVQGVFSLILLYLVLRNMDAIVDLIGAGRKVSVGGIAALQGR